MSYLEDIALAESIKHNSKLLAEQVNAKGYMVPPLPKPGEIIHCQICGRPMRPEDFSEDMEQKKWEFKWHIHWLCRERQFEIAERQELGFLQERRESLAKARGIYGKTINKAGNSNP